MGRTGPRLLFGAGVDFFNRVQCRDYRLRKSQSFPGTDPFIRQIVEEGRNGDEGKPMTREKVEEGISANSQAGRGEETEGMGNFRTGRGAKEGAGRKLQIGIESWGFGQKLGLMARGGEERVMTVLAEMGGVNGGLEARGSVSK